MDTTELSDRLDSVVLVDVREDDEWAAGHVGTSRHIPMGQIGDRLGELPDDEQVVLVCRSGKRSGEVA